MSYSYLNSIGPTLAAHRQLAIVGSTLLITVLFQPLRRGIQAIIDRRFYRRKYDATKIVAAFSATLHQEVDLDQLHEQLLAVVQETMQPASLSLWICPLKPQAARERPEQKRSEKANKPIPWGQRLVP
jgi:hypothetical protein